MSMAVAILKSVIAAMDVAAISACLGQCLHDCRNLLRHSCYSDADTCQLSILMWRFA